MPPASTLTDCVIHEQPLLGLYVIDFNCAPIGKLRKVTVLPDALSARECLEALRRGISDHIKGLRELKLPYFSTQATPFTIHIKFGGTVSASISYSLKQFLEDKGLSVAIM